MYPGYGPVVTSRTRARSGRIQRRKSSLQIGPSVTHVPEIRIAHHVQFVTLVCHYWVPLSLCRIGLYILRKTDVVASLSLWAACPHNFRVLVLYLYCSFRFFMPFIRCNILHIYCIMSRTVSCFFFLFICSMFVCFLIFIEGKDLFICNLCYRYFSRANLSG